MNPVFPLSTQEMHSLRYFLKKNGYDDNIDTDVRMRYSRLMALVNKAKKKETEHLQSYGINIEDDEMTFEMNNIVDRLDGYKLSEMNFFEITNIGEIDLIKAIIHHRIPSFKKISNSRFIDISNQYDKLVLSWKEQCNDSDKKMVFYYLAYYTIEWKYQFSFLYHCLKEMEVAGIK